MDLSQIESGYKKIYWQDIRDNVQQVEPNFAHIVDELDPNQEFPLYLAFYPYGALIADPSRMYFPKQNKTACSILDEGLDKDIANDLGYAHDSLALGMVLDKNIEVFVDFKDEQTVIPWAVYKPGTIFPYAKTLSRNSEHIYAPNNILTIVSGARSTFVLPNVGCFTNHINLKRDYQIQSSPPKKFYEHWKIFTELVHSEPINSHWRSCILFFSEKWFNHLYHDKAWLRLKMHLHELAWQHFEYRRNSIFYEMAFSKIQKKRNLKPNPYLLDTVSHIFATALGAVPGYAPSQNEDFLPLNVLQETYVYSYGMTKYIPTIMQPSHFNFNQGIDPVYYSFQNPSTFVFSPKARKLSSTIFELNELEYIMKIFIEELATDQTICSGTIVSEVAKMIKFKFYHNEFDKNRIINHSSLIAQHDERFYYVSPKIKLPHSIFAADAKFLRGCISIRKNFK